MDCGKKHPSLCKGVKSVEKTVLEKFGKLARQTCSKKYPLAPLPLEFTFDFKNLKNSPFFHFHLDGMLFTVNAQVQRAIDNAINSQILPQIQSSLREANRKRSYEYPETGAEGPNETACNVTSTRNDVSGNPNVGNRPRETYCMVKRPHEANQVTEFFTRRAPSQFVFVLQK